MDANHSEGRRRPWLFPALALALVILAAAALGTLAWMRYARSLQLMTKISLPILTIQGSPGSSMAMDLGDIDVESGNIRSYVFGIKSSQATSYRLQLAHTTNIPFTYTIYPANLDSGEHSCIEYGTSFYYSDSLDGAYLNDVKGGSRLVAETGSGAELHQKTYNDYSPVQTYAEPLYWQSTASLSITPNVIDYYVLVVSWESLKNNKETDMVYLTVFT